MTFLLNGKPSSVVPIADRGLHYGDGLFETIPVDDGNPCLWQRHMQRLSQGCKRLRISMPDPLRLLQETREVIGNAARGVVKIIITRGPGGRGYRPPKQTSPLRIVQFSSWPEHPIDQITKGIRVKICKTRLGLNPSLAGLKTLNRLEQVMARSEWDDPGILEGLMLDTRDYVIEGTMSNLFMQNGDILSTPQLTHCGTAGVMRGFVLEQCAAMDLRIEEKHISLDELISAQALFVTNSVIGIWPVRECEGTAYSPELIPPRLTQRVMDRGFRFS